ncbi:MAG: hypothetical protein GKR92_09060 [Gammaproteobacteria bacterium]|nr:MAG: hypothetical protein GKR92_09060 [Gammaproteobacteria bacterium]
MNKDDQNVNDEKLVSIVCDALDDSINRIDAETSQRIVAARQQALDKPSRGFNVPKLFAAAATAFSIFIAVVIVTTQLNQPMDAEEVQEIELVATQDATELYEELEFYTWLVEEDVTS